jgi:hypothetical protein
MNARALSKPQLLAALERTPQRYWPPRPTRQDKATLVEAIERALLTGGAAETSALRAFVKSA